MQKFKESTVARKALLVYEVEGMDVYELSIRFDSTMRICVWNQDLCLQRQLSKGSIALAGTESCLNSLFHMLDEQ